MMLEVLLGLGLGLMFTKIDESSQLDEFMTMVVMVAAIVILGIMGLFTWIFFACFIIGLFLYKEYFSMMW